MVFKFKAKIKIIALLFLTVLYSCKKENKLETEIGKINLDIEIERFDHFFANVNAEKLPKLKQAYPFMFSEKFKDSFWLAKKNDTLQQQLFKEVDKAFGDFTDTKIEIESLFNHLKFYFPEFYTPRIIAITNDVDYRNKVVVTDTIVVLSLDTYLGSEHEFYSGIQKFIRANFNKEQLVVDMAEKYAQKYIYHPQHRTLLDEMIYFGKILYFKDKIVPFKTEAQRIGYSQNQLNWAIENESYIWQYFVERELLFSTSSKLPGRFIVDAPFSKFYLEDIDSSSPGKIGQYIGWQIVRAYMNQNSVSFKEMLITSTEDIYNNTKFKPRK
ncbi:gliding motility protein GldB [Tamlana sedimentorum]|uniref:Gliding motility protein GldB n=1 Tax=Neotamlana sedimentorum TaxID=1435349 RepID=A0A0D7VYA1_9FLAO|nr:gliding motility lipoprotein GldB [Tamlana sedimentorum]KJD31855.1 gliding motility protein GldB [Tamlana sedimentorum]